MPARAQFDKDTRSGYNETKGQPKPFLPLTGAVAEAPPWRKKRGEGGEAVKICPRSKRGKFWAPREGLRWQTEGENLLAVRRTARNTHVVLTCLSPSLASLHSARQPPRQRGQRERSEVRGQKRRAGACSRRKTQSVTDTRPGCDENQKSDATIPPSEEGGGTRAARDGGRDKPCQNSEFRNQKSERVVAGFPTAGPGAARKRIFAVGLFFLMQNAQPPAFLRSTAARTAEIGLF